MEVQGSGAGEIEVAVSMTVSTPSRSGAESLNASQPTSPERPKKPRVERRGSRTRNRSRSGMRAMLTQV
jgi:hypothetical protein